MGPVGRDFMYRRPEVNPVPLRRTRGGVVCYGLPAVHFRLQDSNIRKIAVSLIVV